LEIRILILVLYPLRATNNCHHHVTLGPNIATKAYHHRVQSERTSNEVPIRSLQNGHKTMPVRRIRKGQQRAFEEASVKTFKKEGEATGLTGYARRINRDKSVSCV
jgi:hypothetical protein